MHLQFNLRINVHSYNSGFLSVEDKGILLSLLAVLGIKMFQKIIIRNECFLQLSWLFISLDVSFLLQRLPLPSLSSLPSPKFRKASYKHAFLSG